MPRLKLADLLRRRKMSLVQLLGEFGITTYAGLVVRCERLGVMPPSEDDFTSAFVDRSKPVNNPQEGVVVVEAPPVLDEISGKEIDPEVPVLPGIKVITTSTNDRSVHQLHDIDDHQTVPTEVTHKKLRHKKKDNHSSGEE